MSLKSLFRKNVEWNGDNSTNTIVYKYPFDNSGRELNNKSSITVRESQVAIFVTKGQIADVLMPGLHELKTEILPILSKLSAWKYAFETPITCDVYFINTKQFTNIKWGTSNPILVKDPEFGPIRVRGFGQYSFSVDKEHADKFLKELFGTNSTFTTSDIQDYLKSMLVSYITDAIGESKMSVIDLSANTIEFNTLIKDNVQSKFEELGLKLSNLIIENLSLPSEVEKAIDERSKYGILGDKTDVMMKVAAAEALKDSAKNTGSAGAFMGAGVGIGAGVGMGNVFAEAFKSDDKPKATASSGKTCSKCGSPVDANAKFCSNCGEKLTSSFCPECGAKIETNSAKFCPNCGHKF